VTPFRTILAEAERRAGGSKALAKLLPKAKSASALTALPDDRYLSLMSLRIFRAGLRHDMVDAKWPAFEEAFHGFEPRRVRAMSDERLERLLADKRLIRHWGKLKSVRENAAAICRVVEEKGGFGRYLAAWPAEEIMALWDDIARRFTQMGGNSAAYFLRMAGKDSFILTPFVSRALVIWGALATEPKGKAGRAKAAEAILAWSRDGSRPLCQVSMILARSVD
jgi:3-methyladenine DNA glycosylase Tag